MSDMKHGKVVLAADGYTVVIPYQFDNPLSIRFDDNGLAVVLKDKKWGVINATGKVIVPYQYDLINGYQFADGIAAVIENGKWGYIDKTGKLVIPCQYDSVSDFEKTGKVVVPIQFDWITPFLGANSFTAAMLDNKWGFIDKTGKLVVPYQFDSAESFVNGLAAVMKNGKWGFIKLSK